MTSSTVARSAEGTLKSLRLTKEARVEIFAIARPLPAVTTKSTFAHVKFCRICGILRRNLCSSSISYDITEIILRTSQGLPLLRISNVYYSTNQHTYTHTLAHALAYFLFFFVYFLYLIIERPLHRNFSRITLVTHTHVLHDDLLRYTS